MNKSDHELLNQRLDQAERVAVRHSAFLRKTKAESAGDELIKLAVGVYCQARGSVLGHLYEDRETCENIREQCSIIGEHDGEAKWLRIALMAQMIVAEYPLRTSNYELAARFHPDTPGDMERLDRLVARGGQHIGFHWTKLEYADHWKVAILDGSGNWSFLTKDSITD